MYILTYSSRATQTRHYTNPDSRTRGFTLLEVMVVVAIMAILTALAAPSFSGVLERWRVQQAIENMKSTIYYARTEAIKRGGKITVVKTPLSSACPQATDTQEWSCGWNVIVDTNDNGTLDTGEEILQTVASYKAVNVINRSSSGQARFKVDRWGQINGLGAQGFTFSPEGPGVSSPNTATLCISSGGRIKANLGEVTC